MNDYPLTYFRKSDGVAFKAKRLTSAEFSMIDPLTNEAFRIGEGRLRQEFRSCKKNRGANYRGKRIRSMVYTKAFREYLGEVI